MKKIFIHVAGNTLGSHDYFIQKLTKRGAKVVQSPEESDVIVVFCPIVSRFETDINEALSSISELRCERVILVAMHPTFNKDYILPRQSEQSNPRVILLVQCLFFETKLLSCPCNEEAVEMVRKKLDLKKKLSKFFQGKQKKSTAN